MDLRVENRGLAVDLADNRRVTQNDAAIFHSFDLGGGNIDHDIPVTQETRHGAQTNQIGFELPKAHIGRHVERLVGVVAQNAIRRKAVARLEFLHRTINIGIECSRQTGVSVKVA